MAQAPGTTHIPISLASLATGYSYRHIRALIEQGKVKAIEVGPGGHADGRVRILVSLRSLKHHQRKRKVAG